VSARSASALTKGGDEDEVGGRAGRVQTAMDGRGGSGNADCSSRHWLWLLEAAVQWCPQLRCLPSRPLSAQLRVRFSLKDA
jgi:hypothetical protein